MFVSFRQPYLLKMTNKNNFQMCQSNSTLNPCCHRHDFGPESIDTVIFCSAHCNSSGLPTNFQTPENQWKNDGPLWSVQHSTIKTYKSRNQLSGVESVELFINGLRDEVHAVDGRCLQSCLPQRHVHYPISVCCRELQTSTALTYCSAVSG